MRNNIHVLTNTMMNMAMMDMCSMMQMSNKVRQYSVRSS